MSLWVRLAQHARPFGASRLSSVAAGLQQVRWQSNEASELLAKVSNLSVPDAVDELCNGAGFVMFEQLMPKAMTEDASNSVASLCEPYMEKDKRSYEFSDDTGHSNIYSTSQSSREAVQGVRLWALLNKGKVFEDMAQIETVMQIADGILGDDFCLGSIAANYLPPGSIGQTPHLDYPYWDYNVRPSWPVKPRDGSPFSMNLQAVFLLDDFTEENGATAVLPYSQKEMEWPDEERFAKEHIQVTGKKGDVFLFTGLLHHASSDNKSNACRSGVLAQYLPKYVRPMEDPEQYNEEVRARASPRMKQLIGMHQPYPKVFVDG